jgi:hypothetical protein
MGRLRFRDRPSQPRTPIPIRISLQIQLQMALQLQFQFQLPLPFLLPLPIEIPMSTQLQFQVRCYLQASPQIRRPTRMSSSLHAVLPELPPRPTDRQRPRLPRHWSRPVRPVGAGRCPRTAVQFPQSAARERGPAGSDRASEWALHRRRPASAPPPGCNRPPAPKWWTRSPAGSPAPGCRAWSG